MGQYTLEGMAKGAARGASQSGSLQAGGGRSAGPMVKRKTPSELRGEQLKRSNLVEHVDESTTPSLVSKGAAEVDNGLKRPEMSRNTRYIDMRMNELYPVKKSRFRMASEKENLKLEDGLKEQPSSLKHLSRLSNIAASKRKQFSCPEDNGASAGVSEDAMTQAHQTIENCSQSKFRSVTELSSGADGSASMATVDMDKALKALVSREPSTDVPAEISGKSGDSSLSGIFCSEFHVSGHSVPLDLTLKTHIHFVSSSSVKWFHRSIFCSTYNGIPQIRFNSLGDNPSNSPGAISASELLDSLAFHSWVHPQSSLPPLAISALTAAGDGAAMDFLTKRQLAWEDSFRSLYFMLRKDGCNMFYVCTPHFVVMFTACYGSGTKKRVCNGYISQSTRSLRACLKEHDVCFTMPVCHSKVEQVTAEDLVELSEIEKHNLGQTCRKSSFSDIDNSPQSLLAFVGNANVHGLYEFLLNYRSSLSSLTAMDVPVLCSPVPFQNAGLSSPEVKCGEMKTIEPIGSASKGLSGEELIQGSPLGLCCVVDIKDSIIPPWVVSNLCALMGADGRNFEASFATERSSVGLNIALQTVCEKTQNNNSASDGCTEDKTCAFGIPRATIAPCLSSGHLKGLKYCNGSYTGTLASGDF